MDNGTHQTTREQGSYVLNAEMKQNGVRKMPFGQRMANLFVRIAIKGTNNDRQGTPKE